MLLSGVHSFSTYPPLGLCHLIKAEIMPSLNWPLETYPCHSTQQNCPWTGGSFTSRWHNGFLS